MTRLTVPEEYGGNQVSALARAIVAEESAKCRLGAYAPALGAFAGGPPVVIWGGTPEQIEKYGMPCVDGKKRAFVAITEPTGGSDPRNNIETRAVFEGGKWRLTGRKMWITAAKGADYGIIFARTRDGTADAPPEITAFIVEPTYPGIEFNEINVIRALSPYEIVLDGCEVPEDNVLGEVGRGFGVAQSWLVDARIPYAAGCIGIAQEALDMACGWVKQRPVRGGRLADKQAIQWMIADSEVELRAARFLDLRCRLEGGCWRTGQGRRVGLQALRHGNGGPGRRPGDADVRRHGHGQGDAAGTLVPGVAGQADRGGALRGAPGGDRPGQAEQDRRGHVLRIRMASRGDANVPVRVVRSAEFQRMKREAIQERADFPMRAGTSPAPTVRRGTSRAVSPDRRTRCPRRGRRCPSARRRRSRQGRTPPDPSSRSRRS